MVSKRFFIAFYIVVLVLASSCDRDLNQQTAMLSVNNMTDLRVAPERPLSIWSVYIAPTNSLTPAIDRSIDLLASIALEPGANKNFTIDSCGQQLNIQVIFSDGSEQTFTSSTAIECDSNYTQDVL